MNRGSVNRHEGHEDLGKMWTGMFICNGLIRILCGICPPTAVSNFLSFSTPTHTQPVAQKNTSAKSAALKTTAESSVSSCLRKPFLEQCGRWSGDGVHYPYTLSDGELVR